jgi:DNA end-binding protein Ku
MWTGTIGFGMVTVPVKLYSAVDRKTVRFHQLSGKSGVRVSQKRVDPSTGEEVPYAEIVKGYELAPDRYVVIEPGELETLEPKKTKTIEIEEFVDLSQIDPVFYDHPYYLAPGQGGLKPYRLLLEAMRETGKVAIARVVIRSKEQLVAVRPMGDVLGMATMLFADEVLSPERLDEVADAAEVKTTKRELDIAKQLVDSLAADFKPDAFQDTYREQVLALIERKAQGRAIAVQPSPEEVAAPAPDLMSALKASLDAVRAREGTAPSGVGEESQQGKSRCCESHGEKACRKETCRQAVGARPPEALRRQTRLRADTRARSGDARGGRCSSERCAAVRDPRAPCDAAALGSAPGARWVTGVVGGAEGAAAGAGRKPPGGGGGGPSAGVPGLRGGDPQGPVRSGPDHDLGQGHV